LNTSSNCIALSSQVLDFVDLSALHLGDRRRHEAYRLSLLGLSQGSNKPLPERFKPSQLARHYRFLGSAYFGMKDLISPLTARAVQQLELRPESTAYVIHDTTRLSWKIYEDKPRLHLSRLSTKTQGFFIHTSLLFSGDTYPDPLGVLGAQAFVHRKDVEGEPATLAYWTQHGGILDHEPDRWVRGVEEAAKHLGDASSRVIHLMDAETDDWSLLAQWTDQGHRFICRLAQNRRILEGPQGAQTIEQALLHAARQSLMEIEVQGRGQAETHKENHPARQARTARVEVRSCTVRVRRPDKHPEGPREVSLNLVQTIELNPPEGEPPISWILATREPVESEEDCMAILRAYRHRWLTEEFYKAMKTGCGFNDLQLESASSLLKEWALLMPAALQLLRLRVLTRAESEIPAQEMVTAEQLGVLNALVPRTQLTLQSPLHLVLIAVARLGGYLRGPIGWLVLGRGYMRLLEYEQVWRAARKAGPVPDIV
jgi:hypothetical protein